MHKDALLFLLEHPPPLLSPDIQPIHLLLPPPPVTSPAQLLGPTSPPSCVGPVEWKMAAEREPTLESHHPLKGPDGL